MRAIGYAPGPAFDAMPASGAAVIRSVDEVIEALIGEDMDLAAFQQAGNTAYEKLGLLETKQAVHKEIGKN